jgi:phosphohistidine swiveling domain-containing protein
MTTVVPVDQFVTDEWYPGFTTAFDDTPWLVEPFRTFAKEDESRFWFLDFHWPRGLTPMGLTWNQDGYAWGTQLAAETLPLPPGRGISVRLAGTHTYAASIPVTDPAHVRERAKRMGQTLPAFLGEFDAIWTGRVAEIERSWSELRRVELEGLSPAELGAFLRRARAFHKRAFEIHFEVMYPLLVNYVAFFGLCIDLGVDPLEIAKFLQGYDTKILETDRELWRLTREARSAGLSSLFAATEPEQLAATLSAAGGRASGWLSTFDAFLDTYGWRTEGTSDIALPSWIEDPTPALGVIKTFLTKEREHDFAAARAAAIEERESAIDAARSSLTREEQTVFDAGLASCQAANFVWWQDEHNFVIDLRVALPMRWACLALGRQVGADRPDDTLFLFWPEIMAVTDGERRYDDYRGLVEARRQYFDHWHDRRPSMPKVLGTVPDAVQDPILTEIFGLNQHFLRAVQTATSDAPVRTLTGIAAARGGARGIARVLCDADQLHRIQPGEVLVCESTSPNWTPAFAKIAACVCDSGGTLSHAAIVGREYGVPTVTAVGLATVLIKNGDVVEVDGTRGIVTVFASADTGEAT